MGHEANHLNGVKADNRIENLEIATRGENQRHAYRNGLIDRDKLSRSRQGARNGRAKLGDAEVHAIRMFRPKLSCAILGKLFGVHKETVARASNGRGWQSLEV